MRHAHQQADFVRPRVREEIASGMLFEHIVNHLQTRDVAVAHRTNSFGEPAIGRANCDSGVEYFAFGFQGFKGFPQLVVLHGVHVRVVDLPQRNRVNSQTLQAFFAGEANVFGGKVVRQFALAAPCFGSLRINVVAEFRRVHQSFGVFTKRVA